METTVVTDTLEATAEAATQTVTNTVDIMSTFINKVIEILSSTGFDILACLIIFLVGIKVVHMITKQIGRMKALSKVDSNVASFLQSLIQFGLYAILAIICCSILGIDTASLIAVLASCGVAVGLAMQGALSNVAGGFIILLFHPFHVGDFVDGGGSAGTVQSINLFYTVLLTPDNKTVMIPNGNMTGAVITNCSTNGKRRVDLEFAASYHAPTQLVKETILKTAKAHAMVLDDPDVPFCRVIRNNTSAVDYVLRVWCANENYWTVYFDMLEQVKDAMVEAGIEIPYPQMDVHVSQK